MYVSYYYNVLLFFKRSAKVKRNPEVNKKNQKNPEFFGY
jgi:hypothetical protein